MTPISTPLRAVRKAQKLTQAELAARAGCHATLISALERGLHPGGGDAPARIAAALGVPLSELFPQPDWPPVLEGATRHIVEYDPPIEVGVLNRENWRNTYPSISRPASDESLDHNDEEAA